MNTTPLKESSLALITKMRINSSDTGVHLAWLAQLMMLGVESSGSLNAEIFFSFEETKWILIQRFYNQEQIKAWQKSDSHQKLMNELTPHIKSKQVTLTESIDSTHLAVGNVSVAVVTHVKKDQKEAYFAYEKKYQSAQAQRPGYRGAYVQPPTKGNVGTWTTLIRFDSPDSMDQWFSSEERKNLVLESDQLVRSTDFKNITTSFPGWFVDEGKSPSNWKTAMLILLGLYPLVMLVITFILPLLQDTPSALANFIGNIITVALTTWVTMPIFIKVFKSWMFSNEKTPMWVHTISILSILCLYGVEIAIFWRFL